MSVSQKNQNVRFSSRSKIKIARNKSCNGKLSGLAFKNLANVATLAVKNQEQYFVY